MVKICLGFFGMIRTKISHDNFINFVKLMPREIELDIFITCCNKYSEFDSNYIDINSFTREMNDIFKGYNTNINVYNYQPGIYIKRTQQLNYKQFGERTNMHPYRIMSLHHCISILSKNITEYIQNTNTYYDNIILTRFDMINKISSFGDILNDKNINNIYLYRDPLTYGIESGEDRVIITCVNGVKILQNLYDSHELINIHENDFWSENIIKQYLKQFESEVNLLVQKDIVMGLSPFKDIKYDPSFLHLQNRFIENYLR
jgi:hypothetical protein